MNQTKTTPVLWDRVALLIVILIMGGGALWYLDTNFGASVAVLILGAVGGVFLWVASSLITQKHTLATLKASFNAINDHAHENARALEYKAKAEGQIANRDNAYIIQMERDAGKYVGRLAQQQARLLTTEPEPEDQPIYIQQRQQSGQQSGFTVYE